MYDPTAVYLVRNIWAEANYKIGIASVIDRRKFQIEEQYGVGPMVVAAVWFPSRKAAQKAETLWHRYFKDSVTDDHGGHEWFSLTTSQLKEFTVWAEYGPNEALLKLKAKGGLLEYRDARDLESTLIQCIPTHGRHRSSVSRTDKKRATRRP